MANFKRGRAKNQRAGCLMCKPWKMNGAKDAETLQERVEDQAEEGSPGNRTRKKKGAGWPRRIKIQCVRCGKLLEVVTMDRKDFHREWLGRRRGRCRTC